MSTLHAQIKMETDEGEAAEEEEEEPMDTSEEGAQQELPLAVSPVPEDLERIIRSRKARSADRIRGGGGGTPAPDDDDDFVEGSLRKSKRSIKKTLKAVEESKRKIEELKKAKGAADGKGSALRSPSARARRQLLPGGKDESGKVEPQKKVTFSKDAKGSKKVSKKASAAGDRKYQEWLTSAQEDRLTLVIKSVDVRTSKAKTNGSIKKLNNMLADLCGFNRPELEESVPGDAIRKNAAAKLTGMLRRMGKEGVIPAPKADPEA